MISPTQGRGECNKTPPPPKGEKRASSASRLSFLKEAFKDRDAKKSTRSRSLHHIPLARQLQTEPEAPEKPALSPLTRQTAAVRRTLSMGENPGKIGELLKRVWDDYTRHAMMVAEARMSPKGNRKQYSHSAVELKQKVSQSLADLAQYCLESRLIPKDDDLPDQVTEEFADLMGKRQAEKWLNIMLESHKAYLPQKMSATSLEEKVHRRTLEYLIQPCYEQIGDHFEFLISVLEEIYHQLGRTPHPSEFRSSVDKGRIEEAFVSGFAKRAFESSLNENMPLFPPKPNDPNPLYDRVCRAMVRHCLEKGFVTEILSGTSGIYRTGLIGEKGEITFFVIKPFTEELGKSFSPRGEEEKDIKLQWDRKAFGDLGPINQILASKFSKRPWAIIANLTHQTFKCGKGVCLVLEYVPSLCTLARLFFPDFHRDELGRKLSAKQRPQEEIDEAFTEYDDETKQLSDWIKNELGLDAIDPFNRIVQQYFDFETLRQAADCDLRFCNADSNAGNILLAQTGNGKLAPIMIDAFRLNPQTFYGNAITPWWMETFIADEPLKDEGAQKILCLDVQKEIAEKRRLAEAYQIAYTERGQELDAAHLIFLKKAVERGLTRREIWSWIAESDRMTAHNLYIPGFQDEVEMVGYTRLNVLYVNAKEKMGRASFIESFGKFVDLELR